MTIAPEALNLIKEFEGYLRHIGYGRVAPYRCPAGVPTIGWGSTFYEDNKKVSMGDPPIDKDRATNLLDYELVCICQPSISKTITVPLHPLMHGALMSFAFNVGTGALASSTLRKRVNAREWTDVPREFKKWTRGGGRVLNGLVRRRGAEAEMFMTGVSLLNSNWSAPTPAPEPADVPSTSAPSSSWWSRIKQWFK